MAPCHSEIRAQRALAVRLGPYASIDSDFPTRHNYLLGLWQNHIERILAEWASELAVPI